MGGWDSIRHVFVYNFTRRKWRKGSDMLAARSFFAARAVDDRRGSFSGSAEVYELATGRWWRVEGAWEEGKCPRGRVKVERSGKVGVLVGGGDGGRPGCRRDGRPGICDRVSMPWGGSWVLPGGGAKRGQNGKMEKMDVGEEFSGFVQSGCRAYQVINESLLSSCLFCSFVSLAVDDSEDLTLKI
ncbi:hypothetical protein AAC387_Pa01g0786 [Persea americana]